MGYGKNLKDALDNRNMTVKDLSRKTGIVATTLYSIIKRDAPVRYNFALRIANVLDIPISTICKDNPYEEGDTVPGLPSDLHGLMTDLNKKTYFSNRTLSIIKKYESNELPYIDELIAEFYVLDDQARADTFDFIKMMMKNHTDPDRKNSLSEITRN